MVATAALKRLLEETEVVAVALQVMALLEVVTLHQQPHLKEIMVAQTPQAYERVLVVVEQVLLEVLLAVERLALEELEMRHLFLAYLQLTLAVVAVVQEMTERLVLAVLAAVVLDLILEQ